MKKKREPDADLSTIMPILMGVWRRFHKISGPADVLQTREFRTVVENIITLQDGLEKGKGLLETDYFADPHLLGAYLLYYWVIHYQQGLSLINELPEPPRRVLDVCSGAAPFGFAALRHGASEVIATDRNATALQLGAEVCGRYGVPMNVRQWNWRGGSLPVSGNFDLIILGHCLEELFPSDKKNWPEHQQQFVSRLLERLTPTGHLLIVDNSFIEPNRRVLQLRDQLVQLGVPVQAPCVWKGGCPALQVKDSPCYAQREFIKPPLIKQLQRAAQINLSSLKMSYIIFKNPIASWPQLEDTKKYYRIISPPVETFQGVRYYLCGTDGKKNLGSNLKEFPPEARAFEYLRRGELISFENALEQNQTIDVVQGTKVTVEAPCGKPLPGQKDMGA